MATQKLNDYERQRLENIRRNDEMMAALKLHSKASLLSNSKRPRVATKSYSVKSEKKPKTETPIVIRRSLRTRGIPPDSKGLDAETLDSIPLIKKSPAKIEHSVAKPQGPISMRDAFRGDDYDSSFVELIVDKAKKETPNEGKEVVFKGSFELGSMDLDPENIARVVPGKITAVKFFPSSSMKMIVAGNKFGNIGFWDVGDDEGRVHLYHPHSAPISGVLVQPHCLSKMYTSCYDGFLRLMDAEKEIFDLIYSSDESIFSLHQPKNEANCLYFGEGRGGLSVWDTRMGKRLSHWELHENRINTIDFNCENPHILATSSTDATARTWDLRYTGRDKLTSLKTLTHKRSVQSAYFSPSGHSLATTSMDNTIGIYSGANLENASSIYHDNQTGRWISTFRAIWGWDDSHLFVGNMKRGVDVVSAVQRRTVMTLQSQHVTAIPCRFDAHPYEVGTLAGATSGGQLYIWTSR